MSTISATGYQRTTLPERVQQLTDAFRGIFGDDINLDPDTLDGQWIGVLAESLSNLDQLGELIMQSFNPQTAVGVHLSRLVALNGIRRQAGTYSVASVTITGAPGVTIPAGSAISSTATRARFVTVADALIGSGGSVVTSVRSEVMGPNAAPAGTMTKIENPLFGWEAVTNPADATLGSSEETDAALRIRRRLSVATAGQAIPDAIYGALANLPGVLAARVYENPSDAVDANGQAPHSILCVVLGGVDADILLTIWQKKSAGVTVLGSIPGGVADIQGIIQPMRFSRPTDLRVYVAVNLKQKPGWPADGAARVQAALAAWSAANQEIGEEMITSRLYDAINTVPGHSITSLFIGLAPAPSSAANLPVAYDAIARISAADVSVTITP